DKSSIEKIKESIRDSNVFVVIFTNNSISNQWVNQELGYAERVRETTPYPLIIPVVEKEIASNVKGFYNKSVTDFIMFDEGDSASMIHDLLKDIRKYVNRNFVVDKVRIRCPHCGNVQEYGAVPSQDDIEKAITKNESFSYNCKQCVKVINLNPKTFQIIGTDNK
ncbi:MAG: toll/interleukin-1 receptor domain-containing protein, partial [Candidatus Parvarchaeota archaeon]